MQDERYNDDDVLDQDEKEIDLLELFGKLWQAKRTLIWAGVIGMVVGLVVAFSIPKEYTTDMKLAPEVTGNTKMGGGGLSALASMAGINLSSGAGTDAVNPMLYPEIVSSVPFMTGLFDVPVTTSDDEHMTLRDYLEYKTKSPWWNVVIGLPFKAIGAVKDLFSEPVDTAKQYKVDPFRLSYDQSELVKMLNGCISSDVDTKTAVISVSVTMQDPLVSALIADTVVSRLQEYVTDYRTEKARKDLSYAEKINEEAKAEYHKAQQRYAGYVDRNHGVVTRAGQTEEERLQNEMSLAYSLYSNTLQQYQLARAKVQEITPVYTVLKPATVPILPSKPSKVVILIGFIFLAVVAASAWVLFGKDFMSSLKKVSSPDASSDK
ncbi:MAG: chain-length determining protein [Muribaculaceae bacterium]|nr:chain-length determining protein [Muribaculaceae bacterium]